MNHFLDMWNIDYIQQQAIEHQHHIEQEFQVFQTTKKLQDFLDSWNNIEPQYQSQAVTDCCIILLNYLSRNNVSLK